MEVRYQDIKVNREYVIRGINAYKYYPLMVVRVIEQPPPYSPAGNFYPYFKVRILQIVGPPLEDYFSLSGNNSVNQESQPGKFLTIFWRNNAWGHPWDDYGLSWRFSNVSLQPLPSDIKNKTLALNELKSIPSMGSFPGGSDFLAAASRAQGLQGGKTFYIPVYA